VAISSEVRAVCGNTASTDPRGGLLARAVPTANTGQEPRASGSRHLPASRFQRDQPPQHQYQHQYQPPQYYPPSAPPPPTRVREQNGHPLIIKQYYPPSVPPPQNAFAQPGNPYYVHPYGPRSGPRDRLISPAPQRRQTPAPDSPPPTPTPVKREGSPIRVPGEYGWEIERLDTVRSLLVPTATPPRFGLGADGNLVELEPLFVRYRDHAIVARAKQVYDPQWDKLFPIRSPEDPSKIHEDYADASNPRRCDSKVKLHSAHFTLEELDKLWKQMCYSNPKMQGKPTKKVFLSMFRQNLERACCEELKATLRGLAPPSQALLNVVEIQPHHCSTPGEEEALKGQYGVVLSEQGLENQPTLARGRILCLFAGARIATDKEATAYAAEYGHDSLHDYGAVAKKFGTTVPITYGAYGGGNVAQYFNSAFVASKKNEHLVRDPEGLNASMHRVTFELTNARKEQVSETMLVCVLHRPLKEEEQIRLDYGTKYTIELKECATAPGGIEVTIVKTEETESQAALLPSRQQTPAYDRPPTRPGSQPRQSGPVLPKGTHGARRSGRRPQ